MKTLLECINQTIEEMTDYMNYNIANTKEKQIKYEPNTRESLFRRLVKKCRMFLKKLVLNHTLKE